MWESDWTQCRGHETLAEMLFSLRLALVLSETEKEWILGRSALSLMRWDRPDDTVDTVIVDPSRWDDFSAALAAAGRLPHGGVKAVQLGEETVLTSARQVSTVALPRTRQVTVAGAVYAMLNGRAPPPELEESG